MVKKIIFLHQKTPCFINSALNLGVLFCLVSSFFVDEDGKVFNKRLIKKDFNPCIFEYVYFARPDATLNDVSVYRSRLRMGQNLAAAWKNKHPDKTPDIVIPAPSTANTSALSFAHELGVRYSEGLYKKSFYRKNFYNAWTGGA